MKRKNLKANVMDSNYFEEMNLLSYEEYIHHNNSKRKGTANINSMW